MKSLVAFALASSLILSACEPRSPKPKTGDFDARVVAVRSEESIYSAQSMR